VGFGDAAETIAAELAAHSTRATVASKAITTTPSPGWRREHDPVASRRLAHLVRAGTLLPGLPRTRERDRIELNIVKRLGRAASVATGLPESRARPRRSRVLPSSARQLGDDPAWALRCRLQQARMLRGAFTRSTRTSGRDRRRSPVASQISVIANWKAHGSGCRSPSRPLVQALLQLAGTRKRSQVAPSKSRGNPTGPSFPYGPLLFSNLAVTEWLVGIRCGPRERARNPSRSPSRCRIPSRSR